MESSQFGIARWIVLALIFTSLGSCSRQDSGAQPTHSSGPQLSAEQLWNLKPSKGFETAYEAVRLELLRPAKAYFDDPNVSIVPLGRLFNGSPCGLAKTKWGKSGFFVSRTMSSFNISPETEEAQFVSWANSTCERLESFKIDPSIAISDRFDAAKATPITHVGDEINDKFKSKSELKSELGLADNTDVPEWKYTSSSDDMSDKLEKTACTTSINEVELKFPYNSVNADFCLRNNSKSSRDSYVKLNGDGQILCGIDDCRVRIRFDKAKPMSFTAVRAADGSSNIIFILGAKKLAAQMKKSKTAVIELSFYQAGSQDLKFVTQGLTPP